MQKSFWLTAFLCLCLSAIAQIKKIKPLSIGDTLRNTSMVFSEGNRLKTVSTNSLQKKLILLDFWNIRCGSCIAAMPKMDALQKQFGDNAQIILVTMNSAKEVDKLFGRIKIARPDLPMVLDDTIFNELFPHDGEPFHVWIDGSKVVRYITDGHNATSKNFTTFLQGGNLQLSLRSELVDFDPARSLLAEAASRLSQNTKHYSLFLQSLSNLTGAKYWSLIKDSFEKFTLFRSINHSALSLYGKAYNKEIYGFDVNLFDWDKNNRFISPPTLHPTNDSALVDEWNSKNLYSYELKMENVTEEQFYKAMQEDLSRYLPYKVQIERKKTKCLVLIKNEKINIKGTANPHSPPKAEFTKEGFLMTNASLSVLLKNLLYINHMITLPVIDETGYKGNLDMCLPSKLYDLSSLRKALNIYGIDLIETQREINMLVVKPKEGT